MRSSSSSMIHSVRMARFNTEVKAMSAPRCSLMSSWPAWIASSRPCADRSTSVQPVNRFSTFQMLWPWRTRISFPGTAGPSAAAAASSVGELAYGLDPNRQCGEVVRFRGAHLPDHALPVSELLAGGLDPGGDAGRGAAAPFVGEHALGEAPVHAQCRIAQPGARDRLPWTLDGELLDARAQPIAAGAHAHLEIHPRRLGDAYLVSAGDL